MTTLLAIPNISEGRDEALVRRIAGDHAIDIHIDPDHNRSVITYGGEPQHIARVVVAMVDRAASALNITQHEGVHPRNGVIDVLPFVLYEGTLEMETFLGEISWEIGMGPGIPMLRYGIGTDKRLPELRRELKQTQPAASPIAGVLCYGFREPLIAFNVNIDEPIETAKEIASDLRMHPGIRALAFQLDSRNITQVSMNLYDLERTSPRAAFDAVASWTRNIVDAELVGLAPEWTLPQFDQLPMRVPPRSIEAALR